MQRARARAARAARALLQLVAAVCGGAAAAAAACTDEASCSNFKLPESCDQTILITKISLLCPKSCNTCPSETKVARCGRARARARARAPAPGDNAEGYAAPPHARHPTAYRLPPLAAAAKRLVTARALFTGLVDGGLLLPLCGVRGCSAGGAVAQVAGPFSTTVCMVTGDVP